MYVSKMLLLYIVSIQDISNDVSSQIPVICSSYKCSIFVITHIILPPLNIWLMLSCRLWSDFSLSLLFLIWRLSITFSKPSPHVPLRFLFFMLIFAFFPFSIRLLRCSHIQYTILPAYFCKIIFQNYISFTLSLFIVCKIIAQHLLLVSFIPIRWIFCSFIFMLVILCRLYLLCC